MTDVTQRSHLSDDRLIEVSMGAPAATAAEEVHLAACEACGTRRSRLSSLLGEVSAAAAADSDAVFSDDRLAAQHARILHRIEQDGRPARVLAFPAASTSEVRPLRRRPVGRWIAGAAAAGLAVGLLAGHLAHELPSLGRPAKGPAVRSAIARPTTQPAVRAVSASMNDEQLLGEIENALDGPQLAVLQPLNDLTPR